MEDKKIDIWDSNIPVEKSSYLNDAETEFINYENLKLENNKLAMIDLFCGAGGFAVGCDWSGFQSVVGIDHLKPAIETWSCNHPHSMACLGDIRNISPEQIKEMLEKKGIHVTVINPYYITGLDKGLLEKLKADHDTVVTLEDGILNGGFGEKIARFYGSSDMKVYNYGLKKEFLDRYDVNEVLKENHLTAEQIVNDVL